jgi:SAM-dependent methyltransferase
MDDGGRGLPRAAHTGPLGADEILDEMMREVSRRGQEPPRGAATDARPAAAPQPAHPAAAGVSLSDLLARDGIEFVGLAYRTVLGRGADEQGRRHLMRSLADGRDKIELLGDLRWSPEGRRVGRTIPGLLPRYLARRLYRLPLVGRPLRLLTALPRVPRMMRDMALLGQAQREAQRDQQAALAELARTMSGMQSALRQVQDRLGTALDETRGLPGQVAQLAGRLEAAEAGGSWMDPVMLLSDRQDEHAGRLAAVEAGLSEIAAQARAVAALGTALQAVRRQQGWDEDGEALAARLAEALRAQEDRVKRAEALVEANRRDLADQQRRLSLILEDVRRRMSHGLAREDLERLEAEDDHSLDALYVAFEDRFRGTRSDIKGRQGVYLPLLAEAGAGTEDRPILDVGAGRGEFLELLREAGLVGRGVDLNRRMAELCAEAGLDCVANDAVAHLSRLPPDSLGAVTGFHIIEHLPFKVLVRLLDESLRALRSGGLVIFETPNPANVLVGSRLFYLDPTHRNPIPCETAAMIAEARGFVRVSIRELHPMRVSFAARDAVLAEQLDRLFHGPQDYALIARKA